MKTLILSKKAVPFLIILSLVMVGTLPMVSADVFTDGFLVSYWAFDVDSSTQVDSHGSNDGYVKGATYNSTGLLGGAYDYDGTDDSINVLDDDGLDIADNLSISVWFYFTGALGSYDVVLSKGTINSPFDMNYGIQKYNVNKLRFMYGNAAGTKLVDSTQAIQRDTWYHYVITWNNGTGSVYVNGVLNNTKSSMDEPLTINAHNLTFGYRDVVTPVQHWEGLIDEVGIWNTTLNLTEVQYLYNSGAGRAYGGGSFTVSAIAPEDNDRTNNATVQFTYNTTLLTAPSLNCSLLLNETSSYWEHTTVTGITTNGTHTINTSTLNETTYDWLINCSDGSTELNTTARSLTIDRTNPLPNVENGNFFDNQNNTKINKLTNGSLASMLINLTYTDSWMNNTELLIFDAANTTTYLNITNTSLTCQTCNLSETQDISTWPVGNYNVSWRGTDDHTVEEISDYGVSAAPDTITFQTPTANVTITNTRAEGDVPTAAKLTDRYTFSFGSGANASKTTWTFVLSSDKPLYYRGDLRGYPAFVTGYQWIDFNTGFNTTIYEVTQEDPYTYEVEIETQHEGDVEFQSIGGLNTYTAIFLFQLYEQLSVAQNLTRDSYNLSWINLTWDLPTGANTSLLYRNGSLIYNGTDTDFNDTGLTGIHYNYYVLPSNGSVTNNTDFVNLSTQTWRPAIVENLTANATGVDWVYLTWNWTGGAQGGVLYNTTDIIFNWTNTTNNTYNVTSLPLEASQTFTLYSQASNGTNWFRNLTINATENQVTVSTATNTTINVIIRNEVNNEQLSGFDINLNFLGTLNYSYSTTTGQTTITSISTDNYTIRHDAIGWGVRDQYLQVTNNSAQNITLYLINNTERTGGVVEVVDQRGILVEDAVIKLLRYFGDENAYNAVQHATTTYDGQAVMDADVYDGFYKWIVEYNDTTYFISSAPESLSPGDDGLWHKTFTIDLGRGYYSSFIDLEQVASTLTFSNATETFTFTWNDASSMVTQGCLAVTWVTGARWTTYNKTCSSGTTGSILITVVNSNETQYKAVGSVDTSNTHSNYVLNTVWNSLTNRYEFGDLGVFMAGAVIVGGSLLFSFSAILVLAWVVLSTLLFTISPYFHLLPFSVGTVVAFASLIVGVSLYMMRR